MTDEARAILGLALIAGLPPFVPGIQARALNRCVTAFAAGAWVVYPLRDRWTAWLLVAVVAVVQAYPRRPGPTSVHSVKLLLEVPLALVFAGAAAVTSALVLDSDATGDAVRRTLASDRAVAITLGLLATVFPLGAAIGALTRPWAQAIQRRIEHTQELPRGLAGAGAYIGWLERSAIFVAIVLGHPGAVAAIFTAKSIARFPSFKEEAFAEYYLIGTLLSIFGATAAGVAIRLALGLSAT